MMVPIKNKTIFFLLLSFFHISFAYKAFITVPVADCYEIPLPDCCDVHEYDGPGVSEDTKSEKNTRCYQLLFNETVEVLGQKNNYLVVAIPHILYCGDGRNVLKNTFWIHKETVVPLNNLLSQNLSVEYIPQPLVSSYNDLAICNKNVVTLTMPFYDPVTQVRYSAGTRFLQVNQLKNTKCYFLAWILDTKKWQWQQTLIPKNVCTTYCDKTESERVADFVQLIRRWANQTDGFIPYVWGGASFCYTMQTKQKHPYPVYCGFDCSCVISRAAQICGIPYFLKNTATIGCVLTPLRFDQDIQDGDLLWWPGHVMIVSSVKNNLLIHARGYGSGYGCLHEVALEKLFKDVVTYDDLKMLRQQNRSLLVLNKKGRIRSKIDNFAFYSLMG